VGGHGRIRVWHCAAHRLEAVRFFCIAGSPAPLALSGLRYYISFYTHRAVSRISEDVRTELLRLSVALPSAELMAQQHQQVKELPRLQERH
jgi:hypothetical protein